MKQTQKLLLFVAAAILLAANAHAGRWITRDPMEVQEHMERDPHAFLDLNPYTFVRNNPLKYFDLNGLNAVAYVDAQGNKWWWGPYDKTPPGYTFQLTPYNQEFPPPGMFWGQDQVWQPHAKCSTTERACSRLRWARCSFPPVQASSPSQVG